MVAGRDYGARGMIFFFFCTACVCVSVPLTSYGKFMFNGNDLEEKRTLAIQEREGVREGVLS